MAIVFIEAALVANTRDAIQYLMDVHAANARG
jgi:hypothetical protein